MNQCMRADVTILIDDFGYTITSLGIEQQLRNDFLLSSVVDASEKIKTSLLTLLLL